MHGRIILKFIDVGCFGMILSTLHRY